MVLALAACSDAPHIQGTRTMSDATPKDPREAAARELAWQAVRKDLLPDLPYKTLVEHGPTAWTFIFVPDARVRGGGAQVQVDKATLTVGDIRFLQ